RLRLDNRAFLDALSQTSTFADFGILQTQFEQQREDLGFLRTSSIADALPNLQSLLQMSVELTQNLPTFEHDNGDRVRSPDDTIDRNQKLSTDAAAEGPRVHWTWPEYREVWRLLIELTTLYLLLFPDS